MFPVNPPVKCPIFETDECNTVGTDTNDVAQTRQQVPCPDPPDGPTIPDPDIPGPCPDLVMQDPIAPVIPVPPPTNSTLFAGNDATDFGAEGMELLA